MNERDEVKNVVRHVWQEAKDAAEAKKLTRDKIEALPMSSDSTLGSAYLAMARQALFAHLDYQRARERKARNEMHKVIDALMKEDPSLLESFPIADLGNGPTLIGTLSGVAILFNCSL